jgi:hypothetical protein
MTTTAPSATGRRSDKEQRDDVEEVAVADDASEAEVERGGLDGQRRDREGCEGREGASARGRWSQERGKHPATAHHEWHDAAADSDDREMLERRPQRSGWKDRPALHGSLVRPEQPVAGEQRSGRDHRPGGVQRPECAVPAHHGAHARTKASAAEAVGGDGTTELVAEDRERQDEHQRGELRPGQDRDAERDDGEHVPSRRRRGNGRLEGEHRPQERRIRDDFTHHETREHHPRHDDGERRDRE